MEIAANGVYSFSNKNSDIKPTGLSVDCTWNSRGWQAKDRVAAAIAQKNGKIIDIVRKTAYCRDCHKKQKPRDDNKITALEYMKWFINYNSCLNLTGSPHLCFFKGTLMQI